MKSSGVERNEIKESTVPFSLYGHDRKGTRSLSSEREGSGSKSRVLDFEDICWMRE
jgi:hypothetical protein